MILAIRTDSMTAYLGLLDDTGIEIKHYQWEAGRQLSVQLPGKIDQLLTEASTSFDHLTGVIAYQGPGSFTGLRIGITIANTIAHEQKIPIVGSTGDDWLASGIDKLKTAIIGTIITPEYGGEANVTKPRK